MATATSQAEACRFCGAALQSDARFCPQCGARLVEDDVADARPATTPLDVAFARGERHTFGLAPPELVLALGLVAFLLAVFFLATGHWIVGAVLVAVALVLARFVVWTARRLPGKRVAQLAVAASNAASDHAGFARVSVSSWLHAGRQVMRLRLQQRQLVAEQHALIRALGEAVFRDDVERAGQLKEQAHACGERIREHERQLELAFATARERVSRERVAIQPTEQLAGGPPGDE
jgi:hypothetical protein